MHARGWHQGLVLPATVKNCWQPETERATGVLEIGACSVPYASSGAACLSMPSSAAMLSSCASCMHGVRPPLLRASAVAVAPQESLHPALDSWHGPFQASLSCMHVRLMPAKATAGHRYGGGCRLQPVLRHYSCMGSASAALSRHWVAGAGWQPAVDLYLWSRRR